MYTTSNSRDLTIIGKFLYKFALIFVICAYIVIFLKYQGMGYREQIDLCRCMSRCLQNKVGIKP